MASISLFQFCTLTKGAELLLMGSHPSWQYCAAITCHHSTMPVPSSGPTFSHLCTPGHGLCLQPCTLSSLSPGLKAPPGPLRFATRGSLALYRGISSKGNPRWLSRNPTAMQELQETWVQFLGQEEPLEEGMTPSSILAWRIPGAEESSRLHIVSRSWTRLNDLACILKFRNSFLAA